MKTYTIQAEYGDMDVWNGEDMCAERGCTYEMETLDEAVEIAGGLNTDSCSVCVMEWDSVAELGYQVWPETTTQQSEDNTDNVGKTFEIQIDDTWLRFECTRWTDDSRVFQTDVGYVEMDWMDYLEQFGLGRIKQLTH